MTRFNSLCTAAIAGFGLISMAVVISAPRVIAGQAGQTSKQVSESATVTATATIVSIDKATRMVTLRGPKGNDVTLYADERITRFDQLKVGDQITATYTEALAVNVRKPGAPAPAKGTESILRSEDKVAGVITRDQTISVTVQAIDLATSYLTVKGNEGRITSFKVKNKDHLRDLKVGDKVDVTYTESLLLKAESAR